MVRKASGRESRDEWFSREIIDSVLEDFHPRSFLGIEPVARPLRMLRGMDMAFGMRHEPQYTSGRIAEARNLGG